MTADLELRIDFGATGNSLGYLGGGWSPAEPEFTWALGEESHILLQRGAEARGDCLLTLDVIPFVHPPEVPVQHLTVCVGDTVVGTSALRRPSLIGFHLREELVPAGEKVVITIRHPDAVRPNAIGASQDARQLSFAVREARLFRTDPPRITPAEDALRGLTLGPEGRPRFGQPHEADDADWVQDTTGLTLQQLAMQFESLGENCEFGLVQRRCDSEPLGLLRFSSTFLRNLIRGLDGDFEGLGAAEEIEPRLEGGGAKKEYMIHEKRYGLVYHTFVYEGDRSVWLVREQETARLKFLRRKFMEELEVAEKIFVYKRNLPVAEDEILPLFLALRRHGDNTLLWVVPEEPGRPAGTVEIAMPGILKGYIDRFAPDDNAHDFSFACWLRICANAYRLSRVMKSPA
ncbi:MAG: hypothetical protein BGO51_16570 [Rhodospirillales bacterium 69-11]|nr:hypothetical protein [Rhodospirillales bacterium]MBN8929249.1 hypothetical protein [Rhodospirillales bacterium]OJW28935.1 MAG: hypothetical protein BGO51_16570 [Rhodospirillales bacterium 69-11]